MGVFYFEQELELEKATPKAAPVEFGNRKGTPVLIREASVTLLVDDLPSANMPAWMDRLVALADNVHAGDPAWPAIEALVHARSTA